MKNATKTISKSALIRNAVIANPLRTAKEVAEDLNMSMNDVSCQMSRLRRDGVIPKVMHQSKAMIVRNYVLNNADATAAQVVKDLKISLNDVSCEMSRMKTSGKKEAAKSASEVNKSGTVRGYVTENKEISFSSRRVANEVGITPRNTSRIMSKMRMAGEIE